MRSPRRARRRQIASARGLATEGGGTLSATSTARIWLAASIVVVFSGWGVARGADAPSGLGDGIALSVRLVRPDEQGERLIGLCRGSRAANPAAALAAWKQATGGRGTLGKPLEAAVAMLNPAMIREFRGLDGAEFLLGRDPDAGGARWRAAVPRDDGSFAALATALALTDGGVEVPLGAAQVFRVGPPGSALASVREGRLALGSTREELRLVVDRPRSTRAARTGIPP